ncbi:hypothetical protein LINPERHAP2_LOCUS36476 [Linum perenne]
MPIDVVELFLWSIIKHLLCLMIALYAGILFIHALMNSHIHPKSIGSKKHQEVGTKKKSTAPQTDPKPVVPTTKHYNIAAPHPNRNPSSYT